ncbi:putative RNA polymerase II subunit B1 CTD phosphatase RPAP2 isoform X2 [Parasteatoda tepidariorum]|uniref:putative RNA polymerase II subunit B1 CTD phosphatase RPAP2 isoform X2 n=1 Tax=Parasteatoda tepidariorum TaxID=114398 RepID=UPI001C7188D8|nr:putative RNA polymerase II subunit B1 CTD phosphatase RPAP2 isoform X2 [Parasteatoda tepidariorum]
MAPEKSPSKEKILQIKRDTLKIVEALLEEEISKEWFLQNVPRQQFKISKNKVYDISERKNFCSNECYKASNFLKAQLHSLPLWLRKPEKSSLELKLLLDSENKGSAGEELLFKYTLSKTEVEQNLHQDPKPIPTMNLNNMLQEDIKDCTEHLVGLNIKEKVYKEKFIFGTEMVKDPENSDEETLSDSQSSDSDEDDDKPSFPEYGNIAAYSNKHMPTELGKRKRAVLIPQLRAPQEPTTNSAQLPINFIAKIFQDWYTEDTLKYLLGERQLYSIKADHLFKTLVNSTDSAENISAVKEEYVNLCLKIDKLPDEEEEDEIGETFDTDICDVKRVKESATKQEKMEKLASDLKLEATKTNLKRKVKRKSKGKNVSFASGTKPSKPINLPEESESTLPEPTLPLIDSLSQGIRRKQILTTNLKNMFANVLPIIDLHYNTIKEEVTDLVDTFSLTPTNTVLKPKQLKCVAVVIFLLLTKTKLKDLYQEAEFTKLCEHALTSLNISQKEVEDLVLDLVNPNQVLKLL